MKYAGYMSEPASKVGYQVQWGQVAPRRKPRSEVGIYLRTHKHYWQETGIHRWPSGDIDLVFTCHRCGSVIATSDVVDESN